MAWTVFIFGALWFFCAITANTGSFRGDLLQFVWFASSAAMMVAAMYLRSIGW